MARPAHEDNHPQRAAEERRDRLTSTDPDYGHALAELGFSVTVLVRHPLMA